MGEPKLNLTLLPGENKKNPKGKKQTTAEQIAAVFSQYPEINEPTFDDETDRKLGVIYNELSKENSRRKEQMLNDFIELFKENSDVLLRFSGDNEERQKVRKQLIDKLCETPERLPKLEELATKIPGMVKQEGNGDEKEEPEEDIEDQKVNVIMLAMSPDPANRKLARTTLVRKENKQILIPRIVEEIQKMILSENDSQIQTAKDILMDKEDTEDGEYTEVTKAMKSRYKELLTKVKNKQETKKELLFFYHGSRELTEFEFSTDEELENVKKQRNLIEDCETLYLGMVERGHPAHENDAKRIAHAMLEVINPTESMRKINAITFAEKHIIVAGIKICRERLKPSDNEFKRGRDYYKGYEDKEEGEFKDEIYRKQKPAIAEATKQGKSLLSPGQFELVAQAMPGGHQDLSKIRLPSGQVFAGLVGLGLSGSRRYDGDWNYYGVTGFSWSSVDWSYFRFKEGIGMLTMEDATSAFPCLLCERTT